MIDLTDIIDNNDIIENIRIYEDRAFSKVNGKKKTI